MAINNNPPVQNRSRGGLLALGILGLLVVAVVVWGAYALLSPNYNPVSDTMGALKARLNPAAAVVDVDQTASQEVPPAPVDEPENLTTEEVQAMLDKAVAGIKFPEASAGLTAEEVQAMLDKAVAGIKLPEASAGLTAEEVQAMLDKAVAGIKLPEAPAATIVVAENQNPENAPEVVYAPQVDFDPQNWLLPVGGPVDFTNPVTPPDGFPTDWATMTQSARESWVTARIGIPVKEIWVKDGIGGYGYAMNAKSVAVAEGTCAAGFTCQLHQADDNRVTFNRGHDEPIKITDGTFALEFALTDEGGICTNFYNAYVYDASHDTFLWPLGEVQSCMPVPQRYVDKIDPKLGEKTREIQKLVGAPVNSIGHIEDGFGLFWVYSDGLGEGSEITCPSGYSCVTSTDDTTWSWIDGDGQHLTGLRGAYIINLEAFDSACAALKEVNTLVGIEISGAPACTP